MKKRWLVAVTIPIVVAMVGVRIVGSETPPAVRTQALTISTVEQTVSCNGVVEAADGIGVMAPVACTIREVHASIGQRVRKGDILAVVDRESTVEHATDPMTKLAVAAMEENLVASDDGIVINVNAEAGKELPFGTPCVVLVRPCDLQVRIAIREKDLRVLQEGMRVRISGDGFAQKHYAATLTEILATASTNSSAPVVEGVVSMDDGQVDDSFRLGLTAKATVITSVTDEGIVIPYEAILSDESGNYVYIVEQGAAKIYRLNDAAPLAQGLLLYDTRLKDSSIIMEPEKVEYEGMTITEESP